MTADESAKYNKLAVDADVARASMRA